ncbi:uncharacterized protein LOC124274552 [Haliotis rubra]|uniref:uncharacterized protein LOC124274552 n=1 Tax=Haliotis rubra TaxID=36100 RepID=UPI001EE5BB95|nr:uncharacterized protein LOC124274552 [Haliotis rubra]
MKFAICVAVVLISSVSGHEWFSRRDAEPDAACRNIYAQMNAIMRQPQFRYLIRDGELSLDCSEQTLAKADECQNGSFVMCSSQFSARQLNIALNAFCRHRTDIENEPTCWTSDNLPSAVTSCAGRDRSAFALCAEQNVANLTECSATTGAIFRQLIVAVFDKRH